jgi:hypothetical protein
MAAVEFVIEVNAAANGGSGYFSPVHAYLTRTAQRAPLHSASHGTPSPLPSSVVTWQLRRWKRASAQDDISRQ